MVPTTPGSKLMTAIILFHHDIPDADVWIIINDLWSLPLFSFTHINIIYSRTDFYKIISLMHLYCLLHNVFWCTLPCRQTSHSSISEADSQTQVGQVPFFFFLQTPTDFSWQCSSWWTTLHLCSEPNVTIIRWVISGKAYVEDNDHCNLVLSCYTTRHTLHSVYPNQP